METRERLASGMRVGRTAEGRPGDCVFVEIDAGRNFVDLVGPFADFDRRFAGRRSEDTRNGRTMREQMRKKAMLLEKPFTIAHGAVMALDEDARPLIPWRRHRPRKTGAD